MSIYISSFITIYICSFQFLLGAVFASFLGCFAYRICKGESIAKGRSHCDECGHELGLGDLIPIVSYIARKGRCKYCGKKISPSCLIGELVLAVLFVLCTLRFDLTPELFISLFFILILYFITLTDLQDRIIPNGCVVAAILVRILYFFVAGEGNWKAFLWLIGQGLIISVPVLLITLLLEAVLKKEALGGGDIKLLFVLGMYLGPAKSLFMLLVACILGIIGAAMAMRKSEDGESVAIPFGPYLSAGSVLALLCGDSIIAAYLSLFL